MVQYIFDKSGNIERPVEKKKESRKDPKNQLNDLTGQEWIRFQKSWFIHSPPPRSEQEVLHPAKFPESLITEFIQFFTKKGQWVLDPFVGTGSTLVACDMTERNGVGIELYEKYVQIGKKRTKQQIICGDARQLLPILQETGQKFHLCITSPPYWNILTRGRVPKSPYQIQRVKKKLDTQYGFDKQDIGLIRSYTGYIETLVSICKEVSKLLYYNRYLIVIIQNVRVQGRVCPLAFDLTVALSKFLIYKGERIWCQDNKKLHPFAYPYDFSPNIFHHYCLIFKKGV